MSNEHNKEKQAFNLEVGWDLIQLGYAILPERAQQLFDLAMHLGLEQVKEALHGADADLPFDDEDENGKGADERDEDSEGADDWPAASPEAGVSDRVTLGWWPIGKTDDDEPTNTTSPEQFMSSEDRRQAAENTRLEAEEHAAEAERARQEAEDNFKQAQENMDHAIALSMRAERVLKAAEARAEKADEAAKRQRPMDGTEPEAETDPLTELLRRIFATDGDDE